MIRTLVARFDDRETAVGIEEIEPSIFRVSLDGEERTFDARRVSGRSVSLLLDGRRHEVSLLRNGDEFDVLVGNHRFAFRMLPEDRARRTGGRLGHETEGRREIKASMPGKVVEVLIKVGDTVAPKQGILIIEAMKMENEIKTPGGGEVKEIRVQPGEAVEAGEVLVVVE